MAASKLECGRPCASNLLDTLACRMAYDIKEACRN